MGPAWQRQHDADALKPMCRERRECNIGKKMRDREKTREEEMAGPSRYEKMAR